MQEHVYKINQLLEGGILSSILIEIKHDLSLSIINTGIAESEKREELYRMTKAIDMLEAKFQGYVNTYNQNQESN